MTTQHWPIFDLHCDLLSYMAKVPDAHPLMAEDIGCAIPHLHVGNVKWQVMAIFTLTEKGSTHWGVRQGLVYRRLITDFAYFFEAAATSPDLDALINSDKIGVVAAIENASGFCEEDEPLDTGFRKLEQLIEHTGPILYITLTHHAENRFGGGNYSTAGLKADGEALLDYLHGRRIAVDLSHTSDATAHGILNYLTRKGLDIPVMASHSNFRTVYDHPRNLPDEISREIIARQGVIGINFVRAFVNNDCPEALMDHIRYGFESGAGGNLCLGADFFYTRSFPDRSREPFYFPEHENASQYPHILTRAGEFLSAAQLDDLAYRNVQRFIQRIRG
jgi:membrane dipeptidase